MLAATIMLAGLATAAAVSDVRRRRISNRLCLGILVAGLAWRSACGLDSAALGLAGAALGFALLFLPFAARWLGAGDIKLVAGLGAWLGPVGVVWAVLFGAVGGGALAVALLAASGAEQRRAWLANLRCAALTLSIPRALASTSTIPLGVPYAAAAVVVFALGVGS